jgi:hypothetical protein
MSKGYQVSNVRNGIGIGGFMKSLATRPAVILILLVGLTACSTDLTYTPTPPQIPAYPNAQRTTVQNVAKGPTNDNAKQTISFQTTDQPQAVLDFYTKALSADGWIPYQLTTPIPDEISFHKSTGNNDPLYHLVVSAKPGNTGQTDVEIDIIAFGPY